MTVEKPKPKQLLQPITTGADSAMKQSEFLAITCNSLKAREKWRVHGAIGFGFASHWLKNWREAFKPIIKSSNRNHVITFDSHLKTALCTYWGWWRVNEFLFIAKHHLFTSWSHQWCLGMVMQFGSLDAKHKTVIPQSNHHIEKQKF